ncbi:zinc finger protein 271 isoform X2 [Anabrus simplex]
MDNGVNTEVIGYDGEVIKEEEEHDVEQIETHLQLMEDGTYMEAEVIPADGRRIVIEEGGEIQDDEPQLIESATLIIDGIHSDRNTHWMDNRLANLADRLCRVCANENQDLVPVFGEQGMELQLNEKIQWHLPIEVKEDDKLPVKMCSTCVSLLNSWDDLIHCCLAADIKLHKMFKDGSMQDHEDPKQNGRIEWNASKRYAALRNSHMLRTMQLLPKDNNENPQEPGRDQQIIPVGLPQLSDDVIIQRMDDSMMRVGDVEMKEVGTVKIETLGDELEDGSKVVDVRIETLGHPQGNSSVKKNFQVTVPAEATQTDSLLQSTIVGAIQDIMQKGEETGQEEVNDGEAEEEEDDDDDEDEDEDVDEDTLAMRERRKNQRLKEFKCNICGYEAPRKSALLLHQRRKHPPQYACNYCDKIFNSILTMKIHERTHTRLQAKSQEQTFFVCEYCGKPFRSKKTLKEHHISAHSDEKPYQCDKCDKNYGSLSSLDIHKSTHSSETPCLCDLCGKTFKHVSNLRSHKRSHLDDMVKNRQVCAKCGKGFRSRFHLSEHMNVHNGVRPYSCDICGKHFHKKIQLRQHGSAHSGTQPYKCHICGVKFNRRGNMTQHVKRHEQERKYTCRVCNESFPTLGAVLTHRKKHTELEVERSIQQQNGGDDPDQVAFKCEVCGKLLAKKETLNIHMRSHTGEKLFECTVCGKKLSNKGTLTYHMRSFHTGERPHTCQFCGDGFLSKEARLVHERIHTGEKPYECQVCGMAFRCSSNLAQHSRVHSDARPHPCPHCDKRFQRKGALVVHIRTHTGERPYACDICGRAFTQKNDMLKHRRTHTHEKPFRCEQCGQVFSQKRDLTKHSLVHTVEQEPEQEQTTQTVVITTSDHLLTYPDINVPVLENAQTLILHRF